MFKNEYRAAIFRFANLDLYTFEKINYYMVMKWPIFVLRKQQSFFGCLLALFDRAHACLREAFAQFVFEFKIFELFCYCCFSTITDRTQVYKSYI